MRRLPGRWVLLGLCTVVAGVGIGLAASGAPLPWSSGGGAFPSARARAYESVDACLLTGPAGPLSATGVPQDLGAEARRLGGTEDVGAGVAHGSCKDFPALIAHRDPQDPRAKVWCLRRGKNF